MMEYDYLLVMKCNENNEPVKNGQPVPRGNPDKSAYEWIKIETSLGHPLVYNSRETTLHHGGNWMGGYGAYIKQYNVDDSSATASDTYGWPNTWSHTKDRWGVVVTNNDVVNVPKPNTYYVLPPGSSSVIDLSEYIAGHPTYQQRTLTFDFAFEMDSDLCAPYFSEFLTEYHGKRLQIVLDNDPNWCYEGRATVGQLKRTITLCTFTMTVECDPYKYEHDTTTHEIDKSTKSL